MGNGESTSRRLSMQRDDEGKITISKNVLDRLSGQENDSQTERVDLNPGEHVIHEDELNKMVERAFRHGQQSAYAKIESDAQNQEGDNDNNERSQTQELRKIASYWKSEFEKENEKVKELLDKEKHLVIANQDGAKKKLDQEKAALNNLRNELEQQRQSLQDERAKLGEDALLFSEERKKQIEEENKEKEKSLLEAFERGASDIESRITPLQRSPICTESQLKVLECYRQNKKKPLRCSKEVEEFVQCVQAARVKIMQKNMFQSE